MSIDKCLMDVLSICALFFGQTEGILAKYCIFAQSKVYYWLALLLLKLALKFKGKISTLALMEN